MIKRFTVTFIVYIFACFTPFSCRIKEWLIYPEKLKEYWSPEQIMGRLELYHFQK
jgi:hypothetical protein